MLYLMYKLLRPSVPISAGLAAWITAQACGADHSTSLAAAIAIALSAIAASIYHYGGQNVMYARKSECLRCQDPESLSLLGLLTFSLSIAVSATWLPVEGTYVCLYNTIAITAYSMKLCRHWTTKNLVMGSVSVTPILIGWAAGAQTHPLIPFALSAAFFSHIAREMIKDVEDIQVNCGIRVTLPMILGTVRVLQISGALILMAAGTMAAMTQFAASAVSQVSLVAGVALLTCVGLGLLITENLRHGKTLVTTSLFLVIFGLL